jgi:hypothetical protein
MSKEGSLLWRKAGNGGRGKGPRRASLLLAGEGEVKKGNGVHRGRLRGGLLQPTGRRTEAMEILAGGKGPDRGGVRDETWGQ